MEYQRAVFGDALSAAMGCGGGIGGDGGGTVVHEMYMKVSGGIYVGVGWGGV